jgi:hypothetical protein
MVRSVATSHLMPSPYPSARMAVEAETWRAFRQAALVRAFTCPTTSRSSSRQNSSDVH